ncbi:MAG TPA: DnaA/Hda family protein [Sphingobium sp.]|uniref:DnaA ATPase domain-containing protein n=1 Tax=Sphingobium sp. TaxID=1912891 RepID=UPI002ED2973D
MQLPLPIDWRSSSQGGSIVIGEGNRDALELLSRPELWPSHCLLLVGPPRSGRSTIVAGIEQQDDVEVIDDADRQDEAALFHRWNAARESNRRLVLVAADAPPRWTITLPDLRSRLSASGVARIGPPDEAMVEAMIVQALGQSGTAFGADVPHYLAPRLPRCYQEVEIAIVALNSESLSSGRKISLPRARAVLEGSGLLSSDD